MGFTVRPVEKKLSCPKSSPHYCCVGNRTKVTADTLPGYQNNYLTGGGYWYSFPAASEGKKWTEKVERRIKGSCVGNAWRKEAGGCPECGADLDQCVARCIQSRLVRSKGFRKDYTKLRPTWDKAFSDKTFCPDQPFPGDAPTSPSLQMSRLPVKPPSNTVTAYHLFQPKY